MPMRKVVNISSLVYENAFSSFTDLSVDQLEENDNASFSSAIFADMLLRYRLISRNNPLSMNEACHPKAVTPYDNQNRISQSHTSHKSLMIMAENDDTLRSIVYMDKKDDAMTWFPLYTFPRPLTNTGVDVWRKNLQDPKSSEGKIVSKDTARGICLVGFGAKTGQFMYLLNDKLIRFKNLHKQHLAQ